MGNTNQQGLLVGHIPTPSYAIFLTMGEYLNGVFSISSLVKMRGEITRWFSKPTSQTISKTCSFRLLSSDSTSKKTSRSENSSAPPPCPGTEHLYINNLDNF
jgi:hypothetical protein